MPDMSDALKRAGLSANPRQPDRPAPPARPPANNPFPPNYPKYFDSQGHVRVDLLTVEAENLADKFSSDNVKRHQLRTFYGHAKQQLQRLKYGCAFGEVQSQIVRLRAFAADRAGRSEGALPSSFKEFIDRNINAIRTQDDFVKGFMPHFESVVAYCARIKD